MHIDNINLNNLRVFECVYRTRCMTTASKHLHLTQSGVSQHIKSLEDSLDARLFDRINKKIMPTEAGDRLFKKAQNALLQIESALEEISTKPSLVQGVVRIGMPVEYGNNVIIPELAQWSQKMESVEFKIEMNFASKINEMILSGELDFAFVDDYNLDKRIITQKVSEETLQLCCSKEYLKSVEKSQSKKGKQKGKSAKAFFESLDYIVYQEGEPVVRSWLAHHFRRKNVDIKAKAQVMDAQGVAKFIVNNAGVGILPDHLVKQLEKRGEKIHIFEGSGRPLTNKISLAYLKNRSRSKLIDSILTYIKSKI